MSLLDKALSTGDAPRGSNDLIVIDLPIEELAELVDAWGKGMISAKQVAVTLAPKRETANPSSFGDGLILAAVRRLIRNGASLLPPG